MSFLYLLLSLSWASFAGNITSWKTLSAYDLKLQKPSAEISKLLGKKVTLLGYVSALDFEKGKLKEFIFVPAPMNCTHDAPESQAQIVVVKMKEGSDIDYSQKAIQVTGTLSLAVRDSNMNEAPVYRMEGESISLYKGKLPQEIKEALKHQKEHAKHHSHE